MYDLNKPVPRCAGCAKILRIEVDEAIELTVEFPDGTGTAFYHVVCMNQVGEVRAIELLKEGYEKLQLIHQVIKNAGNRSERAAVAALN